MKWDETRMEWKRRSPSSKPLDYLRGLAPWRSVGNPIHHMNVIGVEVIDLVTLYLLSF